MARYPCYVCSVNCDDNCIYCETCNTWSHYSCQEIDRSERKEWCKNKKTAYICIRCRTNDDGNYDYFTALERLNQTEHFKTNASLQTTAPLEKNIAALSEKVIAIDDEKTNDNNIVKKRKLKKAKVSKRKGATQKAYDQSSQQTLNDTDECNTTIITEDEPQKPDISENDIDGPASPMAVLNRTYTIRTDDTSEEKIKTNTQTESDVSFNISNRDFSNQPTPLDVSLPDFKLDGNVTPDAPVSFEVVEAGSKRGGKKLTCSDGYTYTVRNVKNKRTYWTCSVRGKTMKCHASVKQYMDMFTHSLNGHNHPADPGAAKKVKIAAKVKEIAKERVFEPAASIVERVMKEMTSTEDFNLPRLDNLVRAANYHRRQRPDDPVSLDFERISVTQLQPGSHQLPTLDLYSLELFECVESTTACQTVDRHFGNE